MSVNYNRRSRGLSTVVTGAIMLSAVAVLGSMIIVWANSNLFEYQQELQNSFSENTNKIKEELVIENVWFKDLNPDYYLNITLSNPSTIGLNVTEIKLVGVSGNKDVTIKKFTNGGFLPQEMNSTEIEYDWNNNSPIDIFVKTLRGSIFRTQIASP
ncbi:MAG: hypothetical protein O6761_01610 [Thaumarchaeota archaeon]|nr:hypothetical protein [Nitrososphaerota archaeon]